tara:strand:+ start:14 stop:220 length:207 start_codon:yes stop_codon:yes gene_type:complete
MKIIGYLYNEIFMNYDVFVANETTYTMFTLEKSELDAILKIDNGSIIEFKEHREAMTECVKTLLTTGL